jgi:hypothetical protein
MTHKKNRETACPADPMIPIDNEWNDFYRRKTPGSEEEKTAKETYALLMAQAE